MSLPRDHHFVPVFYLQRWTRHGKLVEYTRTYRGKLVAKSVGPRATGFQRDLYAFHDLPDELGQYLEDRFLKRADDKASAALVQLLSGRVDRQWLPEIRSAWSRFVLNTLVRHPHPFAEIRNVLHDFWLEPDGVTEQEYQRLRQRDDPPTFREFVVAQGDHLADRIRLRLLQSALDNARAGERFNNMIWDVIDVTHAKHHLLTSDWPLYREIDGDRMAFLLPISPTHVFTASTHQNIGLRVKGTPPDDLVTTMNGSAVSQARLYVYGRDRSQDRFVENRMSKGMQPQPFFPSLSRNREQV